MSDAANQADAVQVWVTDFAADEASPLLRTAGELLTLAERRRAEAMQLPQARAEALLGRALLRSLLAERLGCMALEVPLLAEPQRKPRLAAGSPQCNVAHSHGHLAIAMTQRTPVGIDLEGHDPSIEALEIAETHFAAGERAWLRAAEDAAERERRFFRVWVRKEAVLKAAGDGLVIPLDGFEVLSAAPGECAVPVASEQSGPSTWHLRDLALPGVMGTAFSGALALARPGLPLFQTTVTLALADAMLEAGLHAGQPWVRR